MALGATFFDTLGLGAQKTPITQRRHRRTQSRSEGRHSGYLLIAILVFYALCAIVVLGTSSDPYSVGLLMSPSP